MVDTSAPAAPGLAIDESSPLEHVSGTTLFYNTDGIADAGFTVTGSSGDPESGIAEVRFAAVDGLTGAGSYTWTAPGAAGAQTVTATNGAGLTATADFTLTPDTAAPSGQTVTLDGGPYYSTTAVPLTLANGTDDGAGIDAASGLVERAEAPLADGVCGSFGGYSAVTLVGGTDTTVVSGNCYRYRY